MTSAMLQSEAPKLEVLALSQRSCSAGAKLEVMLVGWADDCLNPVYIWLNAYGNNLELYL